VSRLFFDNHKHKNQRNITDEEGGEVGELDEVDVEEDANLPELPELDPSMVSLLEGNALSDVMTLAFSESFSSACGSTTDV